MKNSILLLLNLTLTLLFSAKLSAQEELTPELLNTVNGIEYTYGEVSDLLHVSIKNSKTGKWGLFRLNYDDELKLIEVTPMEFDSILFYFSYDAYQSIVIFNKNNKYSKSIKLEENSSVDLSKVHYEYDEIIIHHKPFEYDGDYKSEYLFAKKAGKWGIIDIWSNNIILPLEFSSFSAIPKLYVSNYDLEQLLLARKKLKSDLVIPMEVTYKEEIDGVPYLCLNSTTYAQIKNPKTNLWGVSDLYINDDPFNLYKPEYQKLIITCVNGDYGEHEVMIAKKDGKWGMLDFKETSVIHDFIYQTADEVPLTYMSKQEIERENQIKKTLKADLLISDHYNEDGVMLARNKKSQKWGMVMVLEPNEIDIIIPFEYDSIDFYKNELLTGVYNGGKVGIYLPPWSFEKGRQSVPCLYDDYRIVQFSGLRNPYLLVKKNGLWAFIDWNTGELKSEFVLDIDNEDIPRPDFIQNM